MKEIKNLDSRFNSALIIAGAIAMLPGYNINFYIGLFLIILGIVLQAIPFIKEKFK